jgi:hypothetical protein
MKWFDLQLTEICEVERLATDSKCEVVRCAANSKYEELRFEVHLKWVLLAHFYVPNHDIQTKNGK